MAELRRGGGVPATMGKGGWAWELHWGEMKPFPRSIGAGEGRRWELSGEAVGGGNHGSQRLFWAGLRSGETAWELQRGEVKVEVGSNRVGVGWRGYSAELRQDRRPWRAATPLQSREELELWL